MTDAHDPPEAAADLFVPDEWPAIRDDTPAPVRTLPGLLALPGMLLLWFLPRTIGVRLAASGWRAAVVAHLLAFTIGLGLIIWAEAFYWTNPAGMTSVTMGPAFIPELNFDIEFPAPTMSLRELVLGPFTAIATLAHTSSGFSIGLSRIAWLFMAIELGILILAAVLMPFAAAGESTKRLYGRCVRLVLWSTTMFIPVGMAWLLQPIYARWWKLPADWSPVYYGLLSLCVLWWFVVLLRSTFNYAGPAEGPAWETRTPTCEGCGYVIAQLPLATNCPECGKPVAESLPSHREPPAFATAQSAFRTGRAYRKTLRAALNDKSYFSRLAVHRDQSTDRRFFLEPCVWLAMLASFGMTQFGRVADIEMTGDRLADFPVFFVAALLAQIIIVGLFAVVVAGVTRRTLQSTAIVAYHSFVLIVPLIVGTCLLLAGIAIFASFWFENISADYAALVGALLGIAIAIGIGALLCYGAVRRLTLALRNTRRANC